MSRRRWTGVAILAGLPLSQAGHALATALRAAPLASGGHAYAPGFLLLAGLTLSLPAVGAITLLAAANGRSRPKRVVSVGGLALSLFAVQLLTFLIQEAVEASAAHAAPSAATVAFGLAGQAPVALLAAVLMAWLAARLAPALKVLADATEGAQPPGSVLIAASPAWEPALVPAWSELALTARAPPSALFDLT